MQFVWDDLIARARLYRDDNHQDQDGWITESDWLTLFNVEYAQLYRKWIRIGLVSPATTDTSFTGGTTTLTNVVAVLGVAEDLGGGQKRMLTPIQSAWGRNPYWNQDVTDDAKASSWAASGAADSFTITLDPPDPNSTYIVRHVDYPAYATDSTTTVDLPYGTDERLVLGVARRSCLKDMQASALLERLIGEQEAEQNFTAFSRLGDSPRVRRVIPTVKHRTHYGQGDMLGFSMDPASWMWP